MPEEEKKKKKPRGGPKLAPPGYYTHAQARERLGMATSTFTYYVKRGRIKKYVPPLKVEGFYSKKEIDMLANDIALFIHTQDTNVTETRPARAEDTPGIVSVLIDMGWQAATAEQRASWYKVNSLIDYVAVVNGAVVGYVNAVPYTPEAMEDIMSGRRRAWHMTPQDVLPYTAGMSYDLYVGVATRKDIPMHVQRIGFRLLSGFISFLETLAEQGIVIQRMYAVSAEEDGQKLCRDLGFVQQEARHGDLFPRFVLDLETSDSHFARLYRKVIARP